MGKVNVKEVKEFFRKRDIDFVGVAPIERFMNAPKGRRPTDLLPEAKSVVAIGLHILAPVGRAAKMAYSKPEMRHASLAHRVFGYMHLNRLMDTANYDLARLLEKKGYLALPIPASPPEAAKELFGVFSNRHAAVAAGFGEIGWNGLLITPQVGPRVRVASLITEAEIEPDPMYNDKRLCDPKSCGYLCVKKCHMRAFSEESTVKANFGEKVFEYAVLKRRRCMLAHFEPASPDMHVEIPDNPTTEEWLKITQQASPWANMESSCIGRGAPGCRCVYECPVAQ